MKDIREELYQKFKYAIAPNFDADDTDRILSSFLICIDGYELTTRTTEVAVIDTPSEVLIRNYKGSLLTEGKSLRTIKQYEETIRRFMYEINKPLIEAGVSDLRVWLAKMLNMVTPCTCENYRTYINSFYAWLASEDYIPKNPMAKVKPIKFNSGEKKSFSQVEVDALRSNCKSLRERAEVELLLATGVRVTELSMLNIDDIDFRRLEVVVRHGKGDKTRKTYMTELASVHLMNYLESRTDDNEALFVNRFKLRVTKDNVESDVKRIGNRANVEKVHPHRFRRTLATDLYKKGVDIHTIQIILGHANVNETMKYIASNQEIVQGRYNMVMG